MPQRSAGLLIYRRREAAVDILLVHPGGPFWAGKEENAWSIPKGLVDPEEDDLAAARRETQEELGVEIEGRFERLGEFRQPGGKIVIAFAVEADVDVEAVASNTFRMEWPPRSGLSREFPEVDRAAWFDLAEAATKMHKGQLPILEAFAGMFHHLSNRRPRR